MRRRRQNKPDRPSVVSRLPGPNGLGRSGVRLVTLSLVALSLWLLTSFVNQVITSAQMDRRIEALGSEIAQLELEHARVATSVAYAESPAYAEQIAREQLGYAREGDTVILPTFSQLVPAPEAPHAAPLPTLPAVPNWRGWLHALFP